MRKYIFADVSIFSFTQCFSFIQKIYYEREKKENTVKTEGKIDRTDLLTI